MHGERGKQRSVHNTYFTLPELFAMLSNHYSFTWSHQQNWLVLIVMMFAVAASRQYFALQHGYKLGSNQQPATSNQQSAISNQQSAISNQQSAPACLYAGRRSRHSWHYRVDGAKTGGY